MATAEAEMLLPVFEWVVAFGEHMKTFLVAWVALICVVRPKLRLPVVLAPPSLFVAFIFWIIYESRSHARKQGYDLSLPSLRDVLEDHIETGKGGPPSEIIASRKYPPVLGYWEAHRYLGTSFFEIATHTTSQDHSNIHEGYNKGFDWFEATLGEPMFYSSAFYLELYGNEELPPEMGTTSTWNPDLYDGSFKESLDTAQLRKMTYITHALGLKPGMNALDIGSGWGRFAEFMARKGANVTGIVAARDLAEYAKRLNAHHGDKVKIIAKNFYDDLGLPEKSFDVISAVEMSEHAGVAKFSVFLRKVASLLKDNGTFYIQCSGLQRGYARGYNNYEELVWGLFMEQHVFPGADSSTPLGWITEHLERAGFEVQAAHNMGISYGRTLHAWQRTWESKKEEVSAIYGVKAWRRWHVFLSWCVHIAGRQGGSTVNFITATKSGSAKGRYNAQYRLVPGRWVSPSKEELGKLAPRQGDGSTIEKCNLGGYNTSTNPCALDE